MLSIFPDDRSPVCYDHGTITLGQIPNLLFDIEQHRCRTVACVVNFSYAVASVLLAFLYSSHGTSIYRGLAPPKYRKFNFYAGFDSIRSYIVVCTQFLCSRLHVFPYIQWLTHFETIRFIYGAINNISHLLSNFSPCL